jgi:hypothetical protein
MENIRKVELTSNWIELFVVIVVDQFVFQTDSMETNKRTNASKTL